MEFLKDIFEKQIELNKHIGHDLLEIRDDIPNRERFSKEYILAIHAELSETLDWFNWKVWKKTKVEYDEQRIKELHIELIDILHFWTNLCILWDLTPDRIKELYNEKNKENHDRQKRGY